jgi:hypothetical protein
LHWNVENYYIKSAGVLCVEVSIPLMEFLYVKIDDVKEAWLDLLKQFVSEKPGFEISWVMEPRDNDALVTVRIAKVGRLKQFTEKEKSGALSAVDALFDEKPVKTVRPRKRQAAAKG